MTRRTQAERSATTQAALLAAARELFAEHGFVATGREQIAERAGVSRGALYHHFGSKEQLFRAVVEQLEEELGEQVMMAAARSTDAAEQLRFGCMAFLDACLDPAVRRVVLIEAPVVLGWDAWREIDARHGLSLVTHALEAVVASGQMPPTPIGPLAHLLLGALNEAALLVAHAPKAKAARVEVGRTVELLLERLLAS